MVTLEQLRQLVAVVEHGTLSAAGDELHLTQPALSRSMQRLERSLPVTLFARGPNHLEVTEDGLLVAEHARAILRRVDEMHAAVAELERRRRTIDVASCAPAPLWRLLPEVQRACPGMTITSRVASTDEVRAALAADQVQVAITPDPPAPGERGFRLESEHLFLSVPPAHPAAVLDGVRLADLDGETMLLMPDLGFWADLVRERMPRATFLVQDEEAWRAIARSSSLPVFTTDLARGDWDAGARVHVPVVDPEANPTYWCHLGPGAVMRLTRLAEAAEAAAGTLPTSNGWRSAPAVGHSATR